MHPELAKLSHKAWMEFLELYREHPVGPSSTDYEAWLKTRPELKARFDNSGKRNSKMSQIAGYEIWRNAWLACEYQHGIRKAPKT